MAYLKDTNFEAFDQIHKELIDLSSYELQHLETDYVHIINWQCSINPMHIWACSVHERATPEIDQGCPHCEYADYYVNNPPLIWSRKVILHRKVNIEHRFHCYKCNHTWSLIDRNTPPYYSKCINCMVELKLPLFEETYPEFIDEWDRSHNLLNYNQVNDEYPYEIAWCCNKCNQIWYSNIMDREFGIKSCPYCANKKPIPDKTSFGAMYPNLLKEYIGWKERNPYELFPTSKFYTKWKCSECHLPYMANLLDKVEGKALCPNCNDDNPISVEKYERIISEYDHNKNNLETPIEELLVTYTVELSWICNECNCSWNASILGRLYENKDCPYCNEHKAIPGVSSFKALFHNLYVEFTRDNDFNPDLVLPTSSKITEWNCSSCNMPWTSSIRSRVKGKADCPYCNERKAIPGKTSFKSLYPDIYIEFSSKNKFDPDLILPTSSKVTKWNCSSCNINWTSSIRDRVEGNADCPYCNERKAIPGVNSFKALYPDLYIEFSSENEFDQDLILPTSLKVTKWNCSSCNMTWTSSIRDRVEGNADCPYCNGRKAIPGVNSFKALYPDLYIECSNNNDLIPDLVFPTSSKTIEWICASCNMTWTSSIRDRVEGKANCPYCNGRKVIPGVTSFDITHPDLMIEWDLVLNKLLGDAHHQLETSSKIVWWKCKECDYKYPMSIKNKTMFKKRNQISCSKCKGLRRNITHFI